MTLPLSFPPVAECVPRPEDAAADRQALDALREQVLQANLALPRHGLVLFTWGNVSGVERARGWMAIKPSGVAYERLQREDIVVLALADGARVAGTLKPSSDTATHLHLYRQWPGIGGIVHTHSTHATAWAQAGLPIPALGTTHADYFHGEVPCSRPLRPDEIARDYEGATGEVIVETLAGRDPAACPGVLVSEHAPFAWGRDAAQAVHHAAVLEEVARLALYTRQLDAERRPIGTALLDKHYLRKHGPGATYGQQPPAART
jgi:L-ribulose-5-phosphate 4-epimerase